MAFEKVEETKEKPKDEKPKATTAKDGEKAKAKAPKPDTKPRKPARKPGPKTLEARLGEVVKNTGFALVGIGQVHDGIILYSRGGQLAHAWSQAAEHNKQIESFLKKLVEGGVWGGVIASTAAVALPIIQNHGIATRVPNPFMLSQEEVNALPEELKFIVATYEAAAKEAKEAEEAAQQQAGANGPTPAV